MKKRILGIMLTDKCNANCAMCGLSCSPQGQCVIDKEVLLKTIDDAAKVRDDGICEIKQISFSGGEAFLYPELLVKGANYAKEKGFVATVATNGFWGLWPKEKIDGILSVSHLDSVFFSTDPFHMEYVSLSALKGAIEACSRSGIYCSVSIGEAKGEYSSEKFIRNLGDLKYYVDVKLYPFYRVGRAVNLPADVFYPLRPLPPRCYDDSAMGMRPDGTVCPCCSPAVMDTCLSLGNISEQSLADMLTEGPIVDLCHVLRDSESFQKLADIAVEKGQLTDEEKRKLSSCEVCRLMFIDKGYELLKKDIADLYDDLLVKKLFA